MLAWLAGSLASWLVGWLVVWLAGWLVDWLVGWLVGYLFVCLLDCSLAFFGLLCLLVLICFVLLICEARVVEHQKLNQTTPYGVVWLSFWCSTYLPWHSLSLACLSACLFCFVHQLGLAWFALAGSLGGMPSNLNKKTHKICRKGHPSPQDLKLSMIF